MPTPGPSLSLNLGAGSDVFASSTNPVPMASVVGGSAVSAANPQPVGFTATAGTDRSITATTTSQQLMAANTSRKGFFVKNDTAIVVWINLGATAVATAGTGNIAIAANGGYYESPSSFPYSGVVNVIAASTTAAITAREF